MFKITWSCGISKVRFERVGDGFHWLKDVNADKPLKIRRSGNLILLLR